MNAGAPSSRHRSHEERLAPVLVGDLPPDAPEVREWRDDCSECAAALDRLLRLAATLDRIGAEERLDVAAVADEVAAAPTDDGVRAVVERLARTEDAPPAAAGGRPSVPPWLVLAAAALAVFLGANLFFRSAETPPSDPGRPSGVLLGAPFPMAPAGRVGEVRSFTWEFGSPGSHRFVVRFLDPSGRDVVDPVDVEAPPWTPDEALLRRLPARFTWEVSAVSVTGDVVATGRRDVSVGR
ncbi:MAG: hypothetical protein ACF8XB_01100 [Planctomycetota bacterium JB042]